MTEYEETPWHEWMRSLGIAWASAEAKDYEKAHRCYSYCNELEKKHGCEIDLHINADLSLLRHAYGTSTGFIKSPAPTEDSVISTKLEREIKEEQSARGLNDANDYDALLLAENIYNLKLDLEPHFLANTKEDLPHIFFLSTGRCGTVSMYHLFEKMNFLPYHTYLYQVSHIDRYEMMCRFISGDFSDSTVPNRWLKTRAAEWIGAINENTPMVGLNHLDTIFAPIFAAIHPKAKFIYLRRNPYDVFKSMYSKNQWSENQLTPLYYSFDPSFRFRYPRYDLPATIAWYIRFTESFAAAFGSVFKDRFIEIQSELLFSKSESEIGRLSDFIEAPIDRNHFNVRYNQKAHKVELSEDQIKLGMEAFEAAYDYL